MARKTRVDEKEGEVRNWICAAVLLFSSAISFSAALLYFNASLKKLILFLISGILVGFYYGLFNDWIFHYPEKQNREYRNEFARTNTLWVHLISGSIASVAAYLLVDNLSKNGQMIEFSSLGWPHLVLFLIAFVGYTGLLPRWLWFFASRGGPGEPKKS